MIFRVCTEPLLLFVSTWHGDVILNVRTSVSPEPSSEEKVSTCAVPVFFSSQ